MVYDLHNDLLTAEADVKAVLSSYTTYAVNGIILAIWTSRKTPSEKQLCDIHIPLSELDLRVAIEDLGSVRCENADYSRLLEKIHPAYVSLTWNGENVLGGGCGYEAPISSKGRLAVRELVKLGIPLDLSHLSDKAFYSALDEADRTGVRILVTHTASRALSSHPRNITDDMVREVVARGGIIGVAAVPNFLDDKLVYGENCGLERYADHIEHLCSVAGADSVAIGSDFFGTDYLPSGLQTYRDFVGLASELSKRGFTETDTEKIFYGNAEKFMR